MFPKILYIMRTLGVLHYEILDYKIDFRGETIIFGTKWMGTKQSFLGGRNKWAELNGDESI